MQIGPYLHVSRRVRHMVSEDSGSDLNQSFLLIACTGPIFTADLFDRRVRPDTQVFQQIAEFIDSAVKPLSHDVLNPARVPL
jgi:hypothetical protein